MIAVHGFSLSRFETPRLQGDIELKGFCIEYDDGNYQVLLSGMFATKQKDFASDWLGYVANAAGGLAVLLGAVVIFGWFTDSTFLIQLQPQLAPMQFNTALGFVLCGAGLLFLIYPRYENRWHMAMVCGGFSLGLGLLTLLEYSFGLELGIDRLFMEPTITTKTEDPGRMALVTALAYLLSGMVVLMLAGSWRPRLYTLMARLLSMGVLALGLGNLLGYVVGGETPYGWSHPSYMAVHTAGGFILFGVGLLAFIWRSMMGPEQGKSHSLALESGIGLAILTVVLWQSLLAQEQLQTAHMVASQAVNLSAKIENSIKRQTLALVRMAGRWEDHDGTPETEWRHDAACYIADQPGLQTIEWIDPSLHARWIEPLADNEAAPGLESGFEPQRREALEMARQQRQIMITHVIDLVQGGKGFLVYVPLYSDGVFGGFILGVYRIPALIDAIYTDITDTADYRIRIFDGDEEIYSYGQGAGYDEAWRQEARISLYNLSWRLRVTPQPGFLAMASSPLPATTLGAGLLLALLLGLAVNRTHVARQRAVALAESEVWQRGIFDALEEGVLVITPDRLMANMNPAGQTMLGYLQEEIAGQPPAMVHVDHDHVVEFGKRIKESFDKGEVARFEFELKRKNGEVFPTEHNVSLLRDKTGEAIGIVSTICDITVRKQAEVELHNHRERLEKLVIERTRDLELLNEQLQLEIFEHKRSEERLKMQVRRNKLILDTTQEGFWIIDLNGNINNVNGAYCQMVGYTREQLLTMNVADVEVSEDPEKVNAHIQKILTHGHDRFETRHRCRDGEMIDLDVSVSLADIGGERFYFTFFRDITQYKQTKAVLAEREQYLRAMFDNMQEGVITTNEAGTIESANPAALAIFGYDAEQLLGQNEILLMREQDRERHTRILKRYLEQDAGQQQSVMGGGRREVTAVRADGTDFQMSLALDEMWLDGERRFIAIIRDVTESKMAQQALENSQLQLRELADHLQTVREAERAGIAREIHDELGQSLLALNMDLHWIGQRLPKQDQELSAKVQSMKELVDSTVGVVQRISSDLRPAILDDLGLEAAISWYVEQYGKRTGIVRSISMDMGDVNLGLQASTAVFRILQEALTNVGRHSGADEVTVSLLVRDGYLNLEIADNGKGINEQQMSESGSFGLLGMRERALILDGDVSISPRPGGGTVVSLELPIIGREVLSL